MSKLRAVVIGVSHYPHLPDGGGPPAKRDFGLRQLASPALSALRVAEWLSDPATKLAAPLAGPPELLVAPAPAELAVEPKLAGLPLANRANVVAAMHRLRSEAATRDSMTLFYFAGHGIQRSTRDGVLLLSDFGDPAAGGALGNAIELTNLIAGMAPSDEAPEIARTQLWFVDACRTMPSELQGFEKMTVPDVFDVALGGVDDRKWPIFFAAIPGTLAHGRKGKQSVFSKALLRCLRGDAGKVADEEGDDGSVEWRVTIQSLNDALEKHLAFLAGEAEGVQTFTLDGQRTGDAVIAHLAQAPEFDLELELEPAVAKDVVAVQITDVDGKVVVDEAPPLSHPFKKRLAAAIYTVSTTAQPSSPFRSISGKPRQYLPPRVSHTRKVGP